jgi:hypothetical protein
MFTKVTLYHKSVEEGQEVLKAVGELEIHLDHLKVVYNSTVQDEDRQVPTQDDADFESIEKSFDSRRLWMSNSRTVGINFQTNMVSVSFYQGKKPTYFFLDPREVTRSLDSMGAFSALLTH